MYSISPRIHFKMAARVRNADWEDDLELKNDLKEQVSRNLRQLEIVDLMKVKYPIYCWSLRTLSRRLHHFGIRYTDYSVDLDEVKGAVEKEMKGPGSLLGYRSSHKKVREVHGLNVPRNLVYDVMADVNPEGLEERGGVGMPKRPKRTGAFTSNVMYRSNRSFNMPPPRAYPGHLTLLPSRGGGNLIIRVFQGVGNLIPMV